MRAPGTHVVHRHTCKQNTHTLNKSKIRNIARARTRITYSASHSGVAQSYQGDVPGSFSDRKWLRYQVLLKITDG